MWAELTLLAKKDLPKDLEAALRAYFGDGADKRRALDATIWKGDYQTEQDIKYAHLAGTLVYLVFSNGPSGLKIHIENPFKRNDLPLLRRDIKLLTDHIGLFLKKHETKYSKVDIVIWAEENSLQTGTKLSWLERLGEAFKEDFYAKIYIPVATFIASVFLQYDVGKATLNAVVAIIAMTIWILFSATFIKEPLSYKEGK